MLLRRDIIHSNSASSLFGTLLSLFLLISCTFILSLHYIFTIIYITFPLSDFFLVAVIKAYSSLKRATLTEEHLCQAVIERTQSGLQETINRAEKMKVETLIPIFSLQATGFLNWLFEILFAVKAHYVLLLLRVSLLRLV